MFCECFFNLIFIFNLFLSNFFFILLSFFKFSFSRSRLDSKNFFKFCSICFLNSFSLFLIILISFLFILNSVKKFFLELFDNSISNSLIITFLSSILLFDIENKSYDISLSLFVLFLIFISSFFLFLLDLSTFTFIGVM